MRVSVLRAPALLGAMAGALLLAGCASSSAPEHFYSLSTGLPPAAAATRAAYYIEVPAVTVPQQVARTQLVVTLGDGKVDLLEQERWAAPPAAELRQALSLALSDSLGAIDVARTPAPEQAAVYRISINIQRFESAPGQYALLDAVWSVRLAGATRVLACRSVAREPVGQGYDALVDGHRRAVARAAGEMAQAVRALAAGTTPTC